jgi:cellulose biosynthesis protein BcsQ
MHTIILATQKGGSGKSTLTIGLALAAIQAGHTVRLIETDSQGTLSNWQGRRPYAEPLVEPVYSAGDIEAKLLSLDRSGVTLTIIDTAGGVSAATTPAIRYADLCLIPSRPSVADVEATASTLNIVRAWNTPFAFVLNQTPIRGHASATPRSSSAMSCRTISPASSHSLTSSCATIIRMRWASDWRSSNTLPPANRPTKFAASGSGSKPG